MSSLGFSLELSLELSLEHSHKPFLELFLSLEHYLELSLGVTLYLSLSTFKTVDYPSKVPKQVAQDFPIIFPNFRENCSLFISPFLL